MLPPKHEEYFIRNSISFQVIDLSIHQNKPVLIFRFYVNLTLIFHVVFFICIFSSIFTLFYSIIVNLVCNFLQSTCYNNECRLDFDRAELKAKNYECSELQNSQLATDFDLRESKRNKTELENKLKYMENYHEETSKKFVTSKFESFIRL